MADFVPPREDVVDALKAVLAWNEISRSPQLGRFLEYIVLRTLDGDFQAIKAYSIAVDVLGRPADFDPQADPIVRVQARRLRALLDQYYFGPGINDPLRIELPVGRYVPEFVPNVPIAALSSAVEPIPPSREIATHQPTHGQISVSWFVLALITATVAVFAFFASPWGPQYNVSGEAGATRPTVSVMEFQVLSPVAADANLASGLAIELVTDLDQFETISAVYGGGGSTRAIRGSDSDFVLSGIVRREGDTLQYSTILTEVASSGVVWNKAITLTPEQALSSNVLDQVSREFAMVLGSPRGPIHAGAHDLLRRGESIAGDESLYLCRMLFDLYRESGSYTDAERANACLLALVDRDRQTGQALAAQASLFAEFSASNGASVLMQSDRFRVAGQMLDDALAATPTSGFVWEQKARLEQAMGLHDEAEASYSSSLQLNPANADTIASRARHLAFIGRLDEAKKLMQMVINVVPDTPAWYLGVPALSALHEGNYAAAVDYAVAYSQADRELGPVLAIMAAQGIGDDQIVSRFLPRVLEVPSFRATGVLTQLGRRIGDGDLLERVRVSLSNAGVPPQSLLGAF